MKENKAKLLWMKLFGKEVKVWIVEYNPEDECSNFIGLFRTQKLALKGIQEDAKDYYRKQKDYCYWKESIKL